MHLFQYIVIFVISSLFSASAALGNTLLSTSDGGVSEAIQIAIPDDLSPNEIGDFVAPLDETQVRNLLIENLRIDAESNQQITPEPAMSILQVLKGLGNVDSPLGGGIKTLVDSTGTYFSSIGEIVNKISDGQGYAGFFKIVVFLAILIVAARLIEWFCLRKWYKKEFPAVDDDGQLEDWKSRYKHPFYYLLVHLIGLVIFAIAGHLIANFMFAQSSNSFVALTRFFDLAVTFSFLLIVFKFLMHAPPRGLDLIDSRIDKSMLEKSFICFLVIYYVVFHGLVVTMGEFGLSREHSMLSAAATFGLLVNPVIIGAVWLARNDIDRVLFGSTGQLDTHDKPYKFAARARIWPTVVTVALLVVFGLWQVISIIQGKPEHLAGLYQAWWIIILFPLIDLVVSSLLNKLTQLPMFQNASFQNRKSRFIFVIRNIVRLVLITTLFLNIVGALNIPFLSQLENGNIDFVAIMLDIGGVVLAGFIVWEIVLLWIEHKLPDESEDGEVEMEEGAGAAASRTETLLPLLRTTLLIVLFIAVVLSVLSTLGVQIAPLLAGAGVVGIAVGFGSQKLVQDILSGVFFLVDDAFRKGEYVVLAGMGGTVEKLSVRSMQLRHHRGAVQTIPYGEIQTVKNHSRDWTTMKLELRLPYDVDLEQVRKIIKKVGKELSAHEVHGPHILSPLKSQGVMRVEESALIVRMKFTVVPGEQWVIRRVAYTMVRDALTAAGIEFARREVKVRMPEALENLQIKDLQKKLGPDADGFSDTDTDTDLDLDKDEGSSATAAMAAAAAITAVVAQEMADGDTTDPVDDR